jgi:hypothetical protein
MSPATLQNAKWMAWTFLAAVGVGMVWKFARGPETLPEKDEEFARQSKSAMRASGRLSVGDGFWRRAERKAFGVLRLGEQRRTETRR